MNVKVDSSSCAGCQLCVDTAPEVFAMNDDGQAVAKAEAVPAGQEDAVKDSAANCPVGAISAE